MEKQTRPEEDYSYKIQRRRSLNKVIISPIKEFLSDSRSVGILLLTCTVLSLLFSNMEWSSAGYLSFWHMETTSILPGLHLPHTILHWINDFWMTFYFFLVSMEIKRELTIGELSSSKKASLPLVGALGGMIFPAGIYALVNLHSGYIHGWGIPMATDIAFSLGLMSLLGKKAPLSLKVLLMALAIIDDLGGIITIAIFYTESIDFNYLMGAAGIALIMIGLIRFNVKRTFILGLLALVLWYFVFNSGVHATIAGVIMGLIMPLSSIPDTESALHDPVNFVIMPIFALANTALLLPPEILVALSHPASLGIMLGLVVGKPLGIFSFSWLAVKMKISELPRSLNWMHILGMGMSGGIGFTISIFISGLAFRKEDITASAVLAIILASMISGILAYITISRNPSATKENFTDLEEFEDVET